MADKLKAIDIAERILQASDIIASEKLKHLNYDRTINGTIVSADNATNGEYTVDDGSTTFLAYSKDTDYKVGDSVYVTVQNGDWSLQKLITGRYVKDDTKPFAYKSPLDSFLDITDNLVGDGWRNQNQWALLANSDLESPKRYTSTMDIWKIGYTYTKENVIYSEMMDSWQQEGYTKVAISADFRTRLQDNTISGDYGLELVLYDFTRHQDDSVSILPHIFTFSCRDMFGNPYNFLVNSTQSIVLNLDNLNTIVGAKIVFYQRNNFKDTDKQSLVPNNLPPNIFLSNLYVSFGYAKENFDGETVLLYSLGKDTYLSESLPKRQDNPALVDTSANERKMSIRWIHQNDDLSYNCIDQPSEIPWYQLTASEKATKANIHFYRYNLDENDTYDSDSDSVGELAWKELNTSPIRYSTSNNKFAFSYTMNPALQHEMFKVLIEYPTADYITNFLMPNDGYSLTDLSNELNTLEALDNPTDEQSARIEEIEAIINSYVSQIQYYESNILEFINESQVPNLITLELVKGLRIECDKDGYNGNFQCYREDNQIANQAEAYKVRFLRAVWNTAVIQEYKGTTDIYWYIPAANTMIAPPVEGKTFNVENGIQTDDWGMVATGQPYAGMWFFHYKDIERADTSEHSAGSNIACQMEQGFQIKNNYNYQRNNNKVYCVVTKNNHEYEAEFDMTFGISGNNGTKYTFNLDILGGKPAITLANNDQLEIVPHLYNQNNVEITNQFLNNINYEWYSEGNDGLSMSEPDANRHIFISYNSTNMDDCDYYILKATVTQVTHNQRQVNLCAYLPIAVRAAANYEAIDGGWTITYDSSGANPAYYKDPWNLYTRIDNILQPVVTRWSMKLGPDTDNLSSFSGTPREIKERYYPSITEDTRVLVPTSLKITGIGKNIAVRAGSLWSQPIMITSYAYESEMMNAWDGSLTIDEKNGTILSAMLGAGVKNPDNTFSGVLMGDVSSKACYANTAIGLYGYHSGNQSFGFKVDGTAFLGKEGRGRIVFDGNRGIIASSSYTGELNTGMCLDLDDGRIHILGAKRTELSQITTYEFEYDENGNHVMDDQGKYKVKDSITKTYTFQKSGAEIEIKPWSPYFSIKSRNKPLDDEDNVSNPFTELIHIGDDALYLQTVDYQEGKSGVKLNLKATTVNPANGTTNASGGSIKAYGNFDLQAIDASGSSIRLSNNPTEFFKIHYKGNSPAGDLDLIKVSKNSFVMQSPNYTSNASVDTSGDSQAAGVKIDLVNGTIDAKKLYIKTQQFDLTAYQTNNSVNTGLEIHSNGNPYIRFIYNYGSPSPKNILDITSNGTYTLQSINFEQEEKLLGPAYGSGKKIWVGTGTKIDLKRGRIDLYGTTPCTVGNENETRSGAWVSIASDVAQMLDVHYGYDSSGNDIYLLRVGSSNLYLQSANYDTTNHKGMKIDLSNGKITGYNLTLTGYSTDASNATVNGWVNLDTTQPTYPLSIGIGSSASGANFKVKWDGTLYATGTIHLDSNSSADDTDLQNLIDGTIAGWTIGSTGEKGYLAHKDTNSNITHYLGASGGLSKQIGTLTSAINTWVFAAGTNFGVTEDGTLYATNAHITGDITIGDMSSQIGGWKISAAHGLYYGTSETNPDIYLGHTARSLVVTGNGHDVIFKAGANFGVGADGTLWSSAGRIAGWTIASTGIYKGGTVTNLGVENEVFAPGYYFGAPKKMVIPDSNNNENDWIGWDNGAANQDNNIWQDNTSSGGKDNRVVLKAGKSFIVTTDGTLWANNGHFSGTIKGSSISGGTITGGYISGSTIKMGDVEFTTGGSTEVCAYDQNIIVAPSTGAPSVTLDSTAKGSVSVSVSLDVSTTQIHTPADGNVDVVTSVSVNSVDVTFDRPSYVFSGYGYATKKTIHYVGWEES